MGEGGSLKPKNLKKCMELNWNFQRGGEVLGKIPSMGEVWLFSETTHWGLGGGGGYSQKRWMGVKVEWACAAHFAEFLPYLSWAYGKSGIQNQNRKRINK